jgi:hypothetical protein
MHIRLRSDGASGGVPRGAASPRLEGIFARIVRARWLFVAVYALLVPPAALFALRVDQDNSLDRLIVPTDPDFLATRAFQAVFGAGEFALLVAETDEPYSPASVARVDAIEHALQRIPGVTPSSAISIFRRARPEFTASAEDAAAFQRFATGTDLLRRQGLVGEGFLAIALVVDVEGPANRRAALDAVSRAVADANPAPSPLREVTPLGLPFVDAYLDTTQRQAPRYFALFAIFVVTLCLALYRSPRTLLAFLATLAVCLVLCLGFIGATGGSFTLVSPMVPMTILVTVTATLVYLQSRFVERPARSSRSPTSSSRARRRSSRAASASRRSRSRRSARSARWASGSRWGSRWHGSWCSRSSPRCSASCARRRGRSASRPAPGSCASPAGSPASPIAGVGPSYSARSCSRPAGRRRCSAFGACSLRCASSRIRSSTSGTTSRSIGT